LHAYGLIDLADNLSWTASSSFFNSYYTCCSIPFFDGYCGLLVRFQLVPLLVHELYDFEIPGMIESGFVFCEGGGNYPAATVPLVALGTQSGTIEIIDVSTNAVAACFAVHSGVVRGLRWLGNSRLVSFSYTQVIKLCTTLFRR